MIIDAHCHAGLLAQHFPLPFATTMMRSVGKVPAEISIHIPDLLAEMDGNGINKAFLLAFDAERTLGVKIPNDYVAEICRAHPKRFIGFGSVDGGVASAAEEVERCAKELGLQGLKIAPAYVLLPPDDLAWYPIYEAANALQLPILMHTGRTPAHGAWLRFGQPSLHQIAKDLPELSLIMAHMGMPWIDQCLEMLASHAHLYADLSIFGLYQPLELVAQTLMRARQLGVIGKLLWGTDHPFGSSGPFLARMQQLRNDATFFADGQPLSPTEWEQIMGKTALQLFAQQKEHQ